MMHISEALALLGTLAISGWLLGQLGRRQSWQATALIAILFVGMTCGLGESALAAAANDDALSSGQMQLDETLKTNPQGDQYEGLEYPQAEGTPLSDREITARVRNSVTNDLKLSVSNGSVRLSGEVSDRATAQRIVQKVREIPGVHEVSYDLGLAS